MYKVTGSPCSTCAASLMSAVALSSQLYSSCGADVPRIRVVRKHGQYFTLDHRRLYAFRQALRGRASAGAQSIEVTLETFKDPAIVEEFTRKATTTNPHDIKIEKGWMASWKPFIESPNILSVQRKAPRQDDTTDFSDEAMALGMPSAV